MSNNKCEIKEERQVPKCRACGTYCVREKRFNKALRMEQEVWVCPAQKTESCI